MNIIEYIFCQRLFGQVLLIEKNCSKKSAAEKVQSEKCSKKSATETSRQKNRGRKSATEKSRQKTLAEKLQQQHGWGLFMRDMVHLVWGMFCELGFISWDGIGCSILLHISYLLRNTVGIWHMGIGLLVVMCCWSCWFILRLHNSEVVAHGYSILFMDRVMKNRSRKKCGRKIAAENVWQKKCNNMVGVYLWEIWYILFDVCFGS